MLLLREEPLYYTLIFEQSNWKYRLFGSAKLFIFRYLGQPESINLSINRIKKVLIEKVNIIDTLIVLLILVNGSFSLLKLKVINSIIGMRLNHNQ